LSPAGPAPRRPGLSVGGLPGPLRLLFACWVKHGAAERSPPMTEEPDAARHAGHTRPGVPRVKRWSPATFGVARRSSLRRDDPPAAPTRRRRPVPLPRHQGRTPGPYSRPIVRAGQPVDPTHPGHRPPQQRGRRPRSQLHRHLSSSVASPAHPHRARGRSDCPRSTSPNRPGWAVVFDKGPFGLGSGRDHDARPNKLTSEPSRSTNRSH